MDFVAKLLQVLPEESGTSRAGNPWRKKGWVAQTFGPYPRTVKMDAMNAAIDNLSNLEIGKIYNFSVDLESREFNGRWYSDIRVFRAVETAEPNPYGQQPQQYVQQPTAPVAPAAAAAPSSNPFAGGADPFATPASNAGAGAAFEDSSDDLPF